MWYSDSISSVQLLSHVRLFATPWIAARQASLFITNSQSSLRLTSIESVMPSSHLILCWPLLLLTWIFPSIRVFSNQSTLCMRWPKHWSFSFSISPSNEYLGLISLVWTGWISFLSKGLWRVFSNITVQKHHSSVLNFLYNPTLTSIELMMSPNHLLLCHPLLLLPSAFPRIRVFSNESSLYMRWSKY